MKLYTDTVASKLTGRPIGGAPVLVRRTGTALPALLYADANGTLPTVNPVLTGDDGRFQFYVADGTYDFVIVSGGETITLRDIEIYDLDDIAKRLKTLEGAGDPPAGDTDAAVNMTYLHKHRASGDTHDMQAVWRAYRKGFRKIVAAAGLGLGAMLGTDHTGKYIATSVPFAGLKSPELSPDDPRNFNVAAGNLALPDDGLPGAGQPMHGLQLVGEGIDQTIWKQVDNYAWFFNARSPLMTANLRSPYFADFTVEGLGGVATQNGHIFAVGGMTSPMWERLKFTHLSGDGICFQPSPNPDNETHTYYPVIRDCEFDGIDGRGRNPVSVEDAVYGTFKDNFVHDCCTDSDAVSVAAFDVEPRSHTFYACGFWTITGNTFQDIWRGGLALYLNGPDDYPRGARGFTVTDNRFIRCKRWIDMSGGTDPQVDAAVSHHGVIVANNYVEGCGDLRIQGMVDVLVTNNIIVGLDTIKLGDQNLGKGNRHVRVDRNIITRGGLTNGIAVLHDAKTVDCSVSDNTFDDAGLRSTDPNAPGYLFLARYGQVGTRVMNNRVFNPSGRLKAGYLMVTDPGGASIGPSAEKKNNLIYGTPYTVADSFNPLSPVTGRSIVYTFTGGAVGNGQTTYFDIALAGATPQMAFHAWFNQYQSSGGGEVVTRVTAACTTRESVVRVVVSNTGAGLTINSGDKLTVRELFS
jgi:hypothetical protein